MKNRYLYKAKRTDTGEWVKGNRIDDGVTGQVFIHAVGNLVNESDKVGEEGCLRFLAFEVDPTTICQCTGKRDNTRTKKSPEGKLIFEHDIVGFLDTYSTESGYAEQDCIGEVLWDDEELCFYVTDRLSAETYEVLDDCEIIGNRFGNPELLEAE